MGNPVCIDTDLILEHLRGREPGATIFARILMEEIPCTTYFAKFELLCGAVASEEEQYITECLLGFRMLSLDDRSISQAARIYREMRERGKKIGIRDVLVAGMASAHEIPLATGNARVFEGIAGLMLWRPEQDPEKGMNIQNGEEL